MKTTPNQETLYEKNKAAQKVFTEKYGDIIETIRKMPNQTQEDKKARWDYFQEHRTDDLILSLFKAVKPTEDKILHTCYHPTDNASTDANTEQNRNHCEQQNEYSENEICETEYVSDLLSEKKQQALQTAEYFILGLQKQIMTFTGINQSGHEYSIFQAMGMEIQHIKSKEQPENKKLKEKTRISTERLQRIKKLAITLENAQKTTGICAYDSFVKVAHEINKRQFEGQLSEDDCLFAVEYALKIGRFAETTSLDTPLGDDGEETIGDMAQTENNPIEDVIEKLDREHTLKPEHPIHSLISLLSEKKAFEFLIDSRKDLFKGTKRADWQWMVWFTQINILIELKLEECSIRRTNGDMNLPSERINQYRTTENERFYYRYDTEPAGNEDIYFALKPSGDIIYDSILDQRYLSRAFAQENFPSDFYEVYKNILHETFHFTNGIQAECLGKTEGTISKKLKRYKTILQPQFQKWLELM